MRTKKDQKVDEVVVKEQVDQEVHEVVEEQHIDQEVDDVGSGVSDSCFDSGEEQQDELDPGYGLSMDRQVVSHVTLSRLNFELLMCIAWLELTEAFYVAHDIVYSKPNPSNCDDMVRFFFFWACDEFTVQGLVSVFGVGVKTYLTQLDMTYFC